MLKGRRGRPGRADARRLAGGAGARPGSGRRSGRSSARRSSRRRCRSACFRRPPSPCPRAATPGGAFAHPAPRDHPSQPPGPGLEILHGLRTAMCWFDPPDVGRHAQSADDFELSCDESVLLAQPQPVRRQYAELLLKTAGDERGFTTCLPPRPAPCAIGSKTSWRRGKSTRARSRRADVSAADALRRAWRWPTTQPGAARIFDGRPPEDFSLRYVDVWNDDRGSAPTLAARTRRRSRTISPRCSWRTYTEALDRYGEARSLQLLFDAPEGTLSVTLADNQSIHVTRLWLKNAPSESYYLAEPIDWQLLDRLIVRGRAAGLVQPAGGRMKTAASLPGSIP